MTRPATRRNLWVLREAAADRGWGYGICPTAEDHRAAWNRALWRAVHKALHPDPYFSLPADQRPKEPIGMAKMGRPIKRILVVDHIGNGYTVVWTLDGITWDKYNHEPVNPYVKNQIMQRLMASDPQAEVREITSFWIEIPADWATPGCRILG